MPTCFDRLATLRATGQNMAVRDGCEWTPHEWGQVHPDADARLIIECSYQEACFARTTPDLARLAREHGDRIALRAGFV
jgi:hypothetical protein